MLKKYFLTLLIAVATLSSYAQQNDVRICSTFEAWDEMLKTDPQAAIRNASIIPLSQMELNQYAQRNASGTITFTIPVVIHIIHTYGSDNISKAQVMDAMDILNKTYQKRYADTANVIDKFKPIIADCEIQFRLANIDPAGNCTDGITRTYSTLTNSASDAVKSIAPTWDASKYLNVWICTNIASGSGGYSYLPGVQASIDGIVLRSSQFGSIGTSGGSTLAKHSFTHEVGHYLNLKHTWGSTNTPGVASNCSIDDDVWDTPNTIGVLYGCDTNFNSCGDTANIQNFMDYANCEIMFTEGQKARMHSALYSNVGNRNNLWSAANLLATGTEDNHVNMNCNPVADFNPVKNYICAGTTIQFKDVSWNAEITSRKWILPGGTTPSDTASVVNVFYPTPGTYDVTLIAYSAGGSDTLVNAGQVTVLPLASSVYAPVSEGFESVVIPGNDWVVENPNFNAAWAVTNTAAATGTNSIRLQNTGNSLESVDAFITPAFNTTGMTAVTLTYKMAFAPKNSSDSSTFRIYGSSNCGTTWLLKSNRSKSQLYTAPAQFGAFTPNASQWVTETVSLASFNNKSSVRLKFEFVNRNGNNFYIDDINISGTVGINGINASLYNLEVFPNPAGRTLNVKLQPEKSTDILIQLTDIAGRVVMSYDAGKVPAGEFNYQINNDHGFSGMYILQVIAGNDRMQSPVIFNAQ